MALFIMMAGIPGSGKSTLAEKLAREEAAALFSTDRTRRMLTGDEDDFSLDPLVFGRILTSIRESLTMGLNVVYDATNLTPQARKRVLKVLPPKTRKVCYLMKITLAEALARNQARERVVPPEVIADMYNRLKEPPMSEGWDEIRIVE